MILAIFDLHKAPIFLPSLEPVGLSVQEKKLKTDFQGVGCGGQLGFLTGTILALSDLQVALIILPSFESFGSGV